MPTEDNTIIRPNSNRVNEILIFPKNSFSLHLINLSKMSINYTRNSNHIFLTEIKNVIYKM
jgi:hypothetical protein